MTIKTCTTMGCDGGRILLLSSWADCPECRPESDGVSEGFTRAAYPLATPPSPPKVGSVWTNGSETWTVEGVYRDGVAHVAVRHGGRLTGAPDTFHDAGPADFLAMVQVSGPCPTGYRPDAQKLTNNDPLSSWAAVPEVKVGQVWRPAPGSIWYAGNPFARGKAGDTWTVVGVSPYDQRVHVEVRKGGALMGPCEHRDVGTVDFMTMSETGWKSPATQCASNPHLQRIVQDVEPPKAETVEVGDWAEAYMRGFRLTGLIVGTQDGDLVMAIADSSEYDLPREVLCAPDRARLLRRKGDIRRGDVVRVQYVGELKVKHVTSDFVSGRVGGPPHGADLYAPKTSCTIVRLAEDVAKETT